MPLVLSVAVIWNTTLPALVGVPDSVPVAVLKLKPTGSVPAVIVSATTW